MRVRRLLKWAFIALACASLSAPVSADELRRLYAQILQDPTNSELNFRYAELAEQRGEIRKALSAYERVLLNDPNHPDVRRALQRVRRMLQPDTTQYVVELGGAWESNPRRVNGGGSSDGSARGRFTVRDERGIGNGIRWRSIGQLAGDLYIDQSRLSYGYAGGHTGPLFDLTPTIAVHAALGGSAAYFDRRLFYKEATANLTFESYLEGAFHTVRVRGGYRSYGSNFPSDDGYYADITGRFSFPNLFAKSDVVIVSPWYRWSDMRGTGFSVLTPTEQVQPGRYNEFGGRIEYYRRLVEWLTVGGGVAVSQRRYASSFDVAASTITRRRDVMVVPNATVIFHNVMNYQTDLRAEYRYEHNDSNNPVRDYKNHIVNLMLVSRF